MKTKILSGLIYCFLGLLLSNSTFAKSIDTNHYSPKDVRLYTLNCGFIDIHDFSSFSDTNFYPHQPKRLADPCFLIKNPHGWLLWDLGLGDQYINHPVDNSKFGITMTVPVSLKAQLKQLGLKPDDIKLVAISHAHLDHTGNITLFPKATFLVQKAEYNFTQSIPLPPSVTGSTSKDLKNVHKQLLEGDYDVFGDGTVKILSTPGHTPGHQSLEIRLSQNKVIILSGDLYHTRQAYLHKLVPTFNTSRSETLSSMAHMDSILRDTHAKLIIQHDANDFASLPTIPKYLN